MDAQDNQTLVARLAHRGFFRVGELVGESVSWVRRYFRDGIRLRKPREVGNLPQSEPNLVRVIKFQ